MLHGLTTDQRDSLLAFARFVDERLIPRAGTWDHQEHLDDSIITDLAAAHLLVPTLPTEAGGTGMDAVTYGLLSEELGRGCGSVRNLVAVQGMVAHAILRWGSKDLADRWAPAIGTGSVIGSFALTEPEVGSDARNGTTTARKVLDGYEITGRKKWISFAQRAGVFLVFARLDDDPAAFIVERDSPGLSVSPITGLLGLRASELGEVHLDSVVVPESNLLSHGRLTFDLVATSSLDYGRYSTACGSVGLAQGCLDASLDYTRTRTQFDAPLAEHQLVQRSLTEMITSVEAARLLCRQTGQMRAAAHRDAIRQTLIAKYFASRAAFAAAAAAVQAHGASGVSSDYPVQRYLRDAKIQEIIEGTSEIQQVQIAELTLARS
ncbi:alkylation response protein AidB-like acyl-CoA dehydrogenase [Actinokineospora baliensis]|uniref:acyl-CoA dehydrogenase family protein n=1 Tax=Actinokineospora baliensis TaxID=547056 RepID=UPI00195C0884|nr:acyl-CoA dehydrogenase family protein [Actinokineospora baliensis]MBM7776555.1 alkylation response protein AidB-like acyl-CoA dehydrogenase [Actinokineospora baliensis]